MISALALAATLTIHDYATMPTLASPRWSPDGRRIAYVVTKADLERSVYDADVWVIDADGRNDRQLTRAKANDVRPRWSADGKTLAFLSDRDGKNAVWLLPVDGGEARKLVDAPTPVREFEWSPDGTTIAFTRADEPTPEEEKRIKEKDDARVVGEERRLVHVHAVDVATGKTRRLTSGPFFVFSIGWSPDSATIAFSRGPGPSLDDLYRADLYAVSVKSGEVRPLVVRPGLENNPEYSPDGRWLAFTTQNGVHGWLIEHEVHVMPAGGGPSRNVSQAYGRTPDAISWSHDSSALYIEGPLNTTTQLFRVNRDGTGWTNTTNVEGTIDAAHVRDGRAVFIRQSLTEPPELYVAVVGSPLSVVRDSSPGHDRPPTSDNGVVGSRLSVVGESSAQRNGADNRPPTTENAVIGSRLSVVRESSAQRKGADNRQLTTDNAVTRSRLSVVRESSAQPKGADNRQPTTENAVTGSRLSVVRESSAQDKGADNRQPTTDNAVTGSPSSVVRESSAQRKGADNRQPTTDNAVTGSPLSVVRESSAQDKGADNRPPTTDNNQTRLTNHNASYRNRTLGETRLIRWKNPKDGLEIEGLLTLPVGYAGGRVPLLTFVHGGPASRFDQGFLGYLGTTYAPQVLAANGFAVLRPNPRGSGGYGEAFRRANLNDWGGMDWLDINAGIDEVIAGGIADPGRLGMFGWSYGGFIAAWAIGHSDRLKAISVGAAVTDLLSFHGTADLRDFIPHYFEQRDTPDTSLDEMRHAPLSLELLRAHSPLWHLKKTDAKVLIQHGEADERVPLSQGTMLYRLLDELGVDVKMVVYPRTGHGAREPRLRMDLMRRNVEFFTNNLFGRSVSSAP